MNNLMKTFLIIHNEYSSRGGEESVVAFQKQLLEEHGHKVILYIRRHEEMKNWLFGKYWGTFTAIFNPKSRRDLKKIIEKEKPDVALLHNLFPIISPAIIPFLKRKNIKVFQVVHNYRLLCPIGMFYNNGKICEKCTGMGREWNCVTNRCDKGLLGSFSFFLRAFFTRKLGYYNYVDLFLSLTDFQKNKLVSSGFDDKKIKVLPNSYKPIKENESCPCNVEISKTKDVIGFIGRLTSEKGFLDFIETAKRMPQQQFVVAGDNSKIQSNFPSTLLPQNITFLGLLSVTQLPEFYQKCKVILFLSKLYEGFPMILLESMSYGVPNIVYNLAAMPEIIENEKDGFVVEMGDFEAIVKKIDLLFRDKDLYDKLSAQCIEKFSECYTSEKYYERLVNELYLTISLLPSF